MRFRDDKVVQYFITSGLTRNSMRHPSTITFLNFCPHERYWMISYSFVLVNSRVGDKQTQIADIHHMVNYCLSSLRLILLYRPTIDNNSLPEHSL